MKQEERDEEEEKSLNVCNKSTVHYGTEYSSTQRNSREELSRALRQEAALIDCSPSEFGSTLELQLIQFVFRILQSCSYVSH